MTVDFLQSSRRTTRETREFLSARWQELCAQFLPVIPVDSIWRYNRTGNSKTRDQGWKIHVSATILNAPRILENIGPLLSSSDIQFKAPISLQEIYQLNSGLHYSYSQIGKVITVYPQDDRQAVELAQQLHVLTKSYTAPSIPFDNRFCPRSNVYYRYGAFRAMETRKGDGSVVAALRDANGELVPDIYFPGPSHPAWTTDPFIKEQSRKADRHNPLRDSFRVFGVLSQRGKGGVYEALDISSQPARFCLLKEGRESGEVWWDGLDGKARFKT
jgi:hypothetical protein